MSSPCEECGHHRESVAHPSEMLTEFVAGSCASEESSGDGLCGEVSE
jgi:hypothetical protein